MVFLLSSAYFWIFLIKKVLLYIICYVKNFFVKNVKPSNIKLWWNWDCKVQNIYCLTFCNRSRHLKISKRHFYYYQFLIVMVGNDNIIVTLIFFKIAVIWIKLDTKLCSTIFYQTSLENTILRITRVMLLSCFNAF